MQNEAKVVPISHSTTSKNLGNLPPVLSLVRDNATLHIKKNLQELFTSADDILFEMADRATSNSEQNSLFEAMRDLRLKRKSLERGFFHGLLDKFNQLNQRSIGRSRVEEKLNLDTLSLVQNDELEESVALETMIAKVMGTEVQPLTLLSTRLGHLLQRKISNDENPLGPKSLATAFLESCTILGFEIQIKLIILKLFEKAVLDNIHALYHASNELLIKEGVLPDLSSQTTERKRPSVTQRHATSHTADADQHSFGVTQASHTHIAFDELQALLGHLKLSQASTPAPSDAVPISTQDLMRLLSHLQQHNNEQHVSSQIVRKQLDSILQRASQQSKRTRVVGEIDNDIINLVSMLFDFILDDRSIPSALKAMIGRMQIPLLKLAVLDKSFFDNTNHPARRLLNEIGSAALGWSDQDTKHQDSLSQKIESIVQRLQHDFSEDPSIFNELLTDFASFMRTERRRSELLEQRVRDAEEGRARSESARAQVEEALNERLMGKTLAETVVQILQDSWSKVMLLNHLKYGEQSNQWKSSLAVMDQLIWSVSPHTELDTARKLRLLIPKLLEKLHEGFNQAALDPFATSLLFTKLEVLHVQAMQRANALLEPAQPAAETVKATPAQSTPSDTPTEPPPTAESTEPAQEEPAMVEVKAKIALTEPAADAVPEVEVDENHPALALVDKLNAGSWFELTQADEQNTRCKLAAIIKSTGRYIFVNRRGLKVLEKSRAELALAFADGTLTLLDDAQLFDRALESVIGDLRRLKSRD